MTAHDLQESILFVLKIPFKKVFDELFQSTIDSLCLFAGMPYNLHNFHVNVEGY